MERSRLPRGSLEGAAGWAGWPLSDGQAALLRSYAEWLKREAIPAGGLGPGESERVMDRHLADSLVFAGGWPGTEPPVRMIDLGTGAGLPGLPLAVLWPHTEGMLVDRSQRKADLVRRAVRLLGLEGRVRSVQGDAARPQGRAPLVVARAVGPVALVAEWGRGWCEPGGTVVIGGSRRTPPPPEVGETIIEVPEGVLDRPAWLRIMATS